MQLFPSRTLRSTFGFAAIVALTLLAFQSAFAQPSSTWTQIKTGKHTPSPRDGFVMFYDPISLNTILFGGWDGSNHLNDTWAFDGKRWTQVPTSVAPPARAGATAAYDSTLKQAVLFGGFNGNYLNDTWIWDGSTMTWTQATPAHSPVPETLPMAFPDPRSGHADLFGGYDGRFYQSTTWRWKNGDWHRLHPKTSPYARAAAVIGTNPALKQTVVFGGLADVNPHNTWTFDGHNWTLQSPQTQPNQTLLVSAVYDPRFSGVVFFGGFDGQDDNQTWVWDGTNWAQLFPQQSPPPREQFGMVHNPYTQQTIVFGGLDGNDLLRDTWVLKTQ